MDEAAKQDQAPPGAGREPPPDGVLVFEFRKNQGVRVQQLGTFNSALLLEALEMHRFTLIAQRLQEVAQAQARDESKRVRMADGSLPPRSPRGG